MCAFQIAVSGCSADNREHMEIILLLYFLLFNTFSFLSPTLTSSLSTATFPFFTATFRLQMGIIRNLLLNIAINDRKTTFADSNAAIIDRNVAVADRKISVVGCKISTPETRRRGR
jgi:hypothetical protein